MSLQSKLILNHALHDDCYAINPRYCATPMAAQRSNSSAYSHSSHGSTASSQLPVQTRPTASTERPRQHSSCDYSHAQTAYSSRRGPPTSPSEKSDKESKEPQYCIHEDCLDRSRQPFKQFTRKADLTRHYKSTHEKELINCPWPKCHRRGENGFTRMDHLKEHQRGYHGEMIPKRTNSHDTARDIGIN